MITTAFVKIWGETIGAVAWDSEQELALFEYEPNFHKLNWDLAPLKMPIKQNNTFSFPELRAPKNTEFDTFKGLPGLLADVLPDKYGNQMINLWLAQQGRPENSMNPVEQLCFIGSRGMGALEFEPTNQQPNEKAQKIEISSLVDVASNMLKNRESFKANLDSYEETTIKQLITIGTSAGGARPKAVIAYNEETGEVRSGQTKTPKGFTHWIIKLDGVNDVQLGSTRGFGRVEMAYYLMAKAAGIQMANCKLFEENGRAHFMTERFDREGSSTKHHLQTFCALKHCDFNEVNSFSYEQLFQTLRELHLSYPEAQELFRRMVFNVLSKNCDDHTKNFSFLLKKNEKWSLAPAYDLSFAYRADSIWVSQHALSINGKRKGITYDDFLKLAKNMNIKNAKKIIEEVNLTVSHWKQFASEVNVSSEITEHIANNLITF
jgi:serine/threonine-protein kinase HipA